MVIGFGSISFLLLDDDSLPVWDWQRLHVIPQVEILIWWFRVWHQHWRPICTAENKDRKRGKVILTACPSSSVSASSGVEDEGESEPGSDEEGGFEVFHNHFRVHWTVADEIPLSSLSMTVCRPFSKEMASAGLWNVRPNFRSSTRQWWKMGFTLLYTNPLCTAHSNTGWRHKQPPPASIKTHLAACIRMPSHFMNL